MFLPQLNRLLGGKCSFVFFVFLKLFGQCSSTNIPGANFLGRKNSPEGFYFLQLHVGPRNPKRAKHFAAQIIFSAMKLIVFTKFQGILTNELPGVLTISAQELAHFLLFLVNIYPPALTHSILQLWQIKSGIITFDRTFHFLV